MCIHDTLDELPEDRQQQRLARVLEYERRQKALRACKLLRKAAVAASRGNASRCDNMRQLALEAVDGDESEIAAIIEENRFCFVIQSEELVVSSDRRVRSGFAFM